MPACSFSFSFFFLLNFALEQLFYLSSTSRLQLSCPALFYLSLFEYITLVRTAYLHHHHHQLKYTYRQQQRLHQTNSLHSSSNNTRFAYLSPKGRNSTGLNPSFNCWWPEGFRPTVHIPRIFPIRTILPSHTIPQHEKTSNPSLKELSCRKWVP